MTFNENVDFYNNVTIWWNDVIINLFWHCFVSLVRFSYWSKLHVNIMTDFGVMTILYYKGLTRNPEIRNNLVSVFPSIWGFGWTRDTKFCTNVSNGMDPAKCQGYNFYCFWVIKRKPTGRKKITPPPPPPPAPPLPRLE